MTACPVMPASPEESNDIILKGTDDNCRKTSFICVGDSYPSSCLIAVIYVRISLSATPSRCRQDRPIRQQCQSQFLDGDLRLRRRGGLKARPCLMTLTRYIV